MEKLFTVENVYIIKGRGVLLSPGVSLEKYAKIKKDDPIELRFPDGRTLNTKIDGLEYPPSVIRINTKSDAKRTSCILLSSQFKKEDIPNGTDVWLI